MPVANVAPAKIAERADFFERVATDVLRGPSYQGLNLNFTANAFGICAEVYFFLNEAYKAARIPVGSLTKPPKQAAISSLAIGVTMPIRPPSTYVEKPASLHVNGALALRIAAGAVNMSTLNWTGYSRLRFYRMVQGMDFPSLAPMLAEAIANNSSLTSTFQPSLNKDELSKIDALVAYIEVLVDASE